MGTDSRQHEPIWLWDVVEVSKGGNERRFRLSWRMTQEEARAHAVKHGLRLERVRVPLESDLPNEDEQQSRDAEQTSRT